MEIVTCFRITAQKLHAYVSMQISSLIRSLCRFMKQSYHYIIFHSDPFLVQLCYFLCISFAGFLSLKILNRNDQGGRPNYLDLLFTSVSAATVSSMTIVEMEVLSESQLWILTLLMLIGGEVFTSILGLQFMKTKLYFEMSINRRVDSADKDIELQAAKQDDKMTIYEKDCVGSYSTSSDVFCKTKGDQLKYLAVRCLGYVVLSYHLMVLLSSSIAIFVYMSLVSDAADVLRSKGMRILIFSVFTAVSSFANCGFIPTNENMMVFVKNSTLLMLIIPQILAGNTLFAPFLRFSIWIFKKTTKRKEFSYLLQNSMLVRYKHLLPHKHSVYLVLTVFGFIIMQFLLFCILEWNSQVLKGLNSYEKVIGILFQSVNSRHAGESVVDISTLSPAILVLYMVMMYLPQYTSFLPLENDNELPPADANDKKGHANDKKGRRPVLQKLILSHLVYLIIVVILISITERKSLSADPLNFNVQNIAFEVISAYGNVGLSVGYSCKRLLKPDGQCKDGWYGFVGRWSTKGKVILIFVMLFGRLKRFGMEGGKAWKIL